MKCEKCGTELVDGKCPTCIADPKKDAIDRLIERLDQKLSTPEPPARTADPDPPAPSIPDDVAAEFGRLANAGEGDKAIKFYAKYINDATVAPAHAQMRLLATAAKNANLNALRAKYGDKFIKREPLFRSIQSEMNIPDEWLVDMDTCERLFSMAIGQDRDKYVQEETEARLAAAKEEWDKQLTTERLGGVAPAASIVEVFPEDEQERVQKIFDKIGLDDEEVIYMKGQLASYNEKGANVSWKRYIRELEKELDPLYTSFHGAGRHRKRGWTMVGEHPEDQARIDAAARKAALEGAST